MLGGPQLTPRHLHLACLARSMLAPLGSFLPLCQEALAEMSESSGYPGPYNWHKAAGSEPQGQLD